MLDLAIVGAGWYGCHVAATLAALGLNVTVYEREPEIFSSASGNNQFRRFGQQCMDGELDAIGGSALDAHAAKTGGRLNGPP